MSPKPLGEKPMTDTERQPRYRPARASAQPIIWFGHPGGPSRPRQAAIIKPDRALTPDVLATPHIDELTLPAEHQTLKKVRQVRQVAAIFLGDVPESAVETDRASRLFTA